LPLPVYLFFLAGNTQRVEYDVIFDVDSGHWTLDT